MQFCCPYCQGIFQIDEVLAGQQVSCPHCAHVVATSVGQPPNPPPPTAPLEPNSNLPVVPPVILSEVVAPPVAPDSMSHSDALVESPPPIQPVADDGDEPTKASDSMVTDTPIPRLKKHNPLKKATTSKRKAKNEIEGATDPLLATRTEHRKEDRKSDSTVAPEIMTISAEGGHSFTLQNTAKSVHFGDEKVELSSLTPEEKERRRFRRNLVMWCVGAGILVITATILYKMNG